LIYPISSIYKPWGQITQTWGEATFPWRAATVPPPSFSVVSGGIAIYRLSPIQTTPAAHSVSDQAAVGAMLLVPTAYRWGDLTGTWGSYTQPWKAFTGRGVYNVEAGAITVGVVQNSEFSGSCAFPGSYTLQASLQIGATDIVSAQQSVALGVRLLAAALELSSVVSGAAINLTSSVRVAGQIASSGWVNTGLIDILTAFASRAGRSSATWRI
jgi:hypothetical protein